MIASLFLGANPQPNLPMDFPLLVGWTELLKKSTSSNFGVVHDLGRLLDIFSEIGDEDVNIFSLIFLFLAN